MDVLLALQAADWLRRHHAEVDAWATKAHLAVTGIAQLDCIAINRLYLEGNP